MHLYIQKGKADINVRDNMKRTPLILAVSMGKKKTMDLLITMGKTSVITNYILPFASIRLLYE